MQEVEFAPLLPAGLRPLTLGELSALCVDRFPISTTRRMLFDNLKQVLNKLVEQLIVGEVWIDGGFVTEKTNPKDVDFLLRVESTFYENCTSEQRAIIDWMNRDLMAEYRCDTYLLVEWPEGHEKYATGQNLRWEYLDLFRYGKPPGKRKQPKGIG